MSIIWRNSAQHRVHPRQGAHYAQASPVRAALFRPAGGERSPLDVGLNRHTLKNITEVNMAKQAAEPQQKARYLVLGKVFIKGEFSYSPLIPASMCVNDVGKADVIVEEDTLEQKRERKDGKIIYYEHQMVHSVSFKHVITNDWVGGAAVQSGWINQGFPIPSTWIDRIAMANGIQACIASIACPACGTRFYLSESKCPKCGVTISESELLSARNAILEGNDQFLIEHSQVWERRYTIVNTIFLLFLAVGVIGSAIGVWMNLRGIKSFECFIAIGILSILFSLIATIDLASVKKRIKKFDEALS